jgi:alpha/beta superfamily hydrolase
MSEQKVIFKSGALSIEGCYDEATGNRGVVVTHPHPLYGGNMHNGVVQALVRAYKRSGYSTLRFNFRGVGGSQGNHDEGRGEQADVREALQFLIGKGKDVIDLAGYSFGAWVNMLGLDSYEGVRRLTIVSPPVSMMDFDFLKPNSKIRLIVVGDRDEFAELGAVTEAAVRWNPDAALRVIGGADHFFMTHTDELESIVYQFLKENFLTEPTEITD